MMIKKSVRRQLRTISVYISGVAAIAALAGCASTVDKRIAADQAKFGAYPPDVQESIRAGTVEPGFSKGMTRMALGKPDEVYERITAEAREEVWVYLTSRPRFSIGLGAGTGGGRTSVGTGVGVNTGGRVEEALRVHFRNDEVYAVEEPVDR